MNIPCTSEQLIEMSGLQIRRLHEHAKEGVIPHIKGGKWDLFECAKGLIGFYRGRDYGKSANKKEIKTGKEIELLDIKIDQERRRLLKSDEVLRLWSGVIIQMRSAILSFDMPEINKRELMRHLREIDLSEYEPRESNDSNDAPGAGAVEASEED